MSVTQLVVISTYANVENSIIKSVKIYGDFFGIGDVSDIEELLVGVPLTSTKMSLAKLKTIDTTLYFSRMTTERRLQSHRSLIIV